MSEIRQPGQDELKVLLTRAFEIEAPASLREVGSVRLLGDLRLGLVEADQALELVGLKQRDQLPSVGTPMILSVLVDEEVLMLQTRLLDGGVVQEEALPTLRLAWPWSVEIRRRGDVRVAAPELPPLKAYLDFKGERREACLLNLTESGLGLGCRELFDVDLHAQVEVETELPGGVEIQTVGSVRHVERLEGDPLPLRLGMVLGCMTVEAREALRTFIQARRADRSESLRKP